MSELSPNILEEIEVILVFFTLEIYVNSFIPSSLCIEDQVEELESEEEGVRAHGLGRWSVEVLRRSEEEKEEGVEEEEGAVAHGLGRSVEVLRGLDSQRREASILLPYFAVAW